MGGTPPQSSAVGLSLATFEVGADGLAVTLAPESSSVALHLGTYGSGGFSEVLELSDLARSATDLVDDHFGGVLEHSSALGRPVGPNQ